MNLNQNHASVSGMTTIHPKFVLRKENDNFIRNELLEEIEQNEQNGIERANQDCQRICREILPRKTSKEKVGISESSRRTKEDC